MTTKAIWHQKYLVLKLPLLFPKILTEMKKKTLIENVFYYKAKTSSQFPHTKGKCVDGKK